MVLLGRVAKNTLSTLLQKTPDMDSNISLKLLKLIRYSSGRKDGKPTKKKTRKHTTNSTKKQNVVVASHSVLW